MMITAKCYVFDAADTTDKKSLRKLPPWSAKLADSSVSQLQCHMF